MYQVPGTLQIFMSFLDQKSVRLSLSRLPESPQCSSPSNGPLKLPMPAALLPPVPTLYSFCPMSFLDADL